MVIVAIMTNLVLPNFTCFAVYIYFFEKFIHSFLQSLWPFYQVKDQARLPSSALLLILGLTLMQMNVDVGLLTLFFD